MLFEGFFGMLVNRKEDFFRPPVKFRVVVRRKRENHCRNARLFPLAHEIEVQHALYGFRHETVDNTPGFGCKVFRLKEF